MKKIHFYLLGVLLFGVLAAVLWIFFSHENAAATRQAVVSLPAAEESSVRNEPILPIPRNHGQDLKKVELGNKLFHDARLSQDNSISCATCHDLKKGGADGLPLSLGFGGAEGTVNSPTVFNSRFNFKQFWDGRAETLEEQMDGPIQASHEMNAPSWEAVVERLSSDPETARAFAALYPEGITEGSIKDAIAVFERSLITPDSRFDKWLRGDDQALNIQEKEGYRLFKDLGCVVCHQGVNVGGNMFQAFGKFGDYFADRGGITKADLGRMNVTGLERDKHKFKVPSLRNVALTAPYFHDGRTRTLEEAVQVMAKYQLGTELSRSEIDAIIAYLGTLTGNYEGRPLGE